MVDLAALQYLDKKLARGGRFALSNISPRPVRARPVSELNKLKRWGAKYSLTRKARYLLTHDKTSTGVTYDIHVPNWDHASEIWKTLAYMSCIPIGHRQAFTLRLTLDVQMMALRSKRGPAKYLQDRIATQFRIAFPGRTPPAFMMVLECTGDGSFIKDLELHVHGVVDVPGLSEDIETVKTALRRAGGTFTGPGRARQVTVRPALNPIGWAAYLSKARLSTPQAIALAQTILEARPSPTCALVHAASARLRARAKRWFTQHRASGELIWVSRKKMIARAR